MRAHYSRCGEHFIEEFPDFIIGEEVTHQSVWQCEIYRANGKAFPAVLLAVLTIPMSTLRLPPSPTIAELQSDNRARPSRAESIPNSVDGIPDRARCDALHEAG